MLFSHSLPQKMIHKTAEKFTTFPENDECKFVNCSRTWGGGDPGRSQFVGGGVENCGFALGVGDGTESWKFCHVMVLNFQFHGSSWITVWVDPKPVSANQRSDVWFRIRAFPGQNLLGHCQSTSSSWNSAGMWDDPCFHDSRSGLVFQVLLSSSRREK